MATRLKDADRPGAYDDYAQLLSLLKQLQKSERERKAAQRDLTVVMKQLEEQSVEMRRRLPDLFD